MTWGEGGWLGREYRSREDRIPIPGAAAHMWTMPATGRLGDLGRVRAQQGRAAEELARLCREQVHSLAALDQLMSRHGNKQVDYSSEPFMEREKRIALLLNRLVILKTDYAQAFRRVFQKAEPKERELNSGRNSGGHEDTRT